MSALEPLPVNGVPATEAKIAPAPPPAPAALPGEPVTAQFVRDHLGDVQGNILKGHGRPFVKCIFVTFDEGAKVAAGPAIRAWIRQLAGGVITSAPRQLAETELYQTCGIPGGLFGAFFLSSAGYRYLDVRMPAQPAVDPGTNEPVADAFAEGMKNRQVLRHDRESAWEDYFDSEIHAMLLLADVDQLRLNEAAARAIMDIKPVTKAVHVEHGHVLTNENGDGIEHFGYADGVSQPLFLQEDVDKGNESGHENKSVWDPSAGLNLVLSHDGNGTGAYSFGSYFVFRKLEQNVKGFKKKEEELAESLHLEGHDAERAGALLVGRFEDGTPVTLQGAEGMRHPIPNGFTFQDDGKGLRCPFQAHIRKVNPRTKEANAHRIARRGIPYGTRKADFSDQPVKDVGLLFMCYQQRIENQFEAMQVHWANDPDFGQAGSGLDPIIGQGPRTEQAYAFKWGKDAREKGKFNFDPFVKMRGGEYFFAPSISFLKGL